MSNPRKQKFSRREFAGVVALGVAAPAWLGEALAQEEQKQEAPKAQAVPPEEEENWLERGRQALREFNVPAETEPAFLFHAARNHGRR